MDAITRLRAKPAKQAAIQAALQPMVSAQATWKSSRLVNRAGKMTDAGRFMRKAVSRQKGSSASGFALELLGGTAEALAVASADPAEDATWGFRGASHSESGRTATSSRAPTTTSVGRHPREPIARATSRGKRPSASGCPSEATPST